MLLRLSMWLHHASAWCLDTNVWMYSKRRQGYRYWQLPGLTLRERRERKAQERKAAACAAAGHPLTETHILRWDDLTATYVKRCACGANVGREVATSVVTLGGLAFPPGAKTL